MSRAFAVVRLACLALAVAATPARSEVQRVAPDGTVHRVDVDVWAQAGRVTGTLLRATRQRPRGGKDVSLIPGTDDAAIDRDPAIEINPATGNPIVVWSRNDGSGFNLYVSRFDGVWSAARLLVRLDGDDVEPQVRFDSKYLHVSWRQIYAGQTTYWRSSFSPSNFVQVFGPERIPTDDAVSIAPGGGPAIGADATTGAQFFCAAVFSPIPGDPGRAYVWGVRDEPVPINYRQSFLLPAEVRSVVLADVGLLGGRFTFWFTTPDRLYYTTLSNGRWSEMRIIELTAATTASEARLLLLDLNQRATAGGH